MKLPLRSPSSPFIHVSHDLAHTNKVTPQPTLCQKKDLCEEKCKETSCITSSGGGIDSEVGLICPTWSVQVLCLSDASGNVPRRVCKDSVQRGEQVSVQLLKQWTASSPARVARYPFEKCQEIPLNASGSQDKAQLAFDQWSGLLRFLRSIRTILKGKDLLVDRNKWCMLSAALA